MWHRRLGTIWWKKTHLQIQIEKSSTNGSDFPLESRICCQKQNLWWQNVAKSLRHPGIQSFPWPEVAWRRGHTQPNDGHQGVPSRCPSPGFGARSPCCEALAVNADHAKRPAKSLALSLTQRTFVQPAENRKDKMRNKIDNAGEAAAGNRINLEQW